MPGSAPPRRCRCAAAARALRSRGSCSAPGPARSARSPCAAAGRQGRGRSEGRWVRRSTAAGPASWESRRNSTAPRQRNVARSPGHQRWHDWGRASSRHPAALRHRPVAKKGFGSSGAPVCVASLQEAASPMAHRLATASAGRQVPVDVPHDRGAGWAWGWRQSPASRQGARPWPTPASPCKARPS